MTSTETPTPSAPRRVSLLDLLDVLRRVDDLESEVARLRRELDQLRAQVGARS